jgi:hypothetical protein
LAQLKNSEWAYQPTVLAITGTNGKTTVTRLTGVLLERAGKQVGAGDQSVRAQCLQAVEHGINAFTLKPFGHDRHAQRNRGT